MNSEFGADAHRPGGLAVLAEGRLSVPDLALLTITGGAPAHRADLAAWLRQNGVVSVATPAEAAAPLAERRLVFVDIVEAGHSAYSGHEKRDAVFHVAKGAHVASIALEPGASVERVEGLVRAGFAAAVAIPSPLEALIRRPLPVDLRHESGPFDVIGDVHGCHAELVRLLGALGYPLRRDGGVGPHPEGRQVVFVGDLCDRGPENVPVLRLVMEMTGSGVAHCVVGNHDDRLLRRLRGRSVSLSHGLVGTMEELDQESASFRDAVAAFIAGLPSHLWLDGGRLVVAHAGLRQEMQGRDAKSVRSFALYGETTGERDSHGLPVRLDWARNYRGDARVVHGHTPFRGPGWSNNALCIDSGCVFGGLLTAYRWPEERLLATPADRVHCAPPKPLAPPRSPADFALTND